MLANKQYLELLTTALSTRTGVKITEGKGWRTNIRTGELQVVADELRTMPFNVVRGLLLHEIGHLKYTTEADCDEALAKKFGKDLLGGIYNAFEDIRIEHNLVEDYDKFALGSLADCNNYSLLGYKARGDMSKIAKVSQFLFLSMCLGLYRTFYDYMSSSIGSDCYYITQDIHFDPEVTKRWFDRHDDVRRIIDRVMHCNSTYQAEQIVNKEFLPIIEDWIKDDKKQGFEPVSMSTPQSMGKTAGLKDDYKSRSFEKPDEKEAMAVLSMYSQTLANRLQSVLQEKQAVRWYGNHKSGKLLDKNAYKVGIGDNRAFSKRNTPNFPHYKVFMALDKSGSMSRNLCYYSFMGAALLKATCKRLKFDLTLYEYNTNAYEIKSLNEYQGSDGGTQDSEVLRLIDKKVKATDENIVFIMTDGETSGSSDRQQLIKNLEKKNTTIVGIGIGGGVSPESLKQYYKIGLHVPSVEKLPEAIINSMRRMIHR